MAPSSSVAVRRSIRWLPDAPSEPTDTLVLTAARSGVFVDVRFVKGEVGGEVEWAFAGVREELPDGGVRFVHHVDSRTLDARAVVDVGHNTVLADGATLEIGEMVNPATGRVQAYEEVWEEREGVDGGVDVGGPRAVFVANKTRTAWGARVGGWQAALGRRAGGAEGGFWAWQARWDAQGRGWEVVHCAGVGVGEVVVLPGAPAGGWREGAGVEWMGEEWDVVECGE